MILTCAFLPWLSFRWFDDTFRCLSQTHKFQEQKGLEYPDEKVTNMKFSQLMKTDLSQYPELARIVFVSVASKKPLDGIMEWIEGIYHDFRGIMLGTVTPAILSSAFRGQSVKREELTKKYLSRIIVVVHRFVVEGLRMACTCPTVFQRLFVTMVLQLVASYEHAMKQAVFLVELETQRAVHLESLLQQQDAKDTVSQDQGSA